MSDEPQRSQEEEGDNNAWMSTFSDLLMLMLTFFVLLLTMSSMDKQKIDKVVRPGLQMQQGPSQHPSIMETPAIPRVMRTSPSGPPGSWERSVWWRPKTPGSPAAC